MSQQILSLFQIVFIFGLPYHYWFSFLEQSVFPIFKAWVVESVTMYNFFLVIYGVIIFRRGNSSLHFPFAFIYLLVDLRALSVSGNLWHDWSILTYFKGSHWNLSLPMLHKATLKLRYSSASQSIKKYIPFLLDFRNITLGLTTILVH